MPSKKTDDITREELEFLRLRSIFAYEHELCDDIQAIANAPRVARSHAEPNTRLTEVENKLSNTKPTKSYRVEEQQT